MSAHLAGTAGIDDLDNVMKTSNSPHALLYFLPLLGTERTMTIINIPASSADR